ncbi:MAG TPA: hypothetical protein VK209_09350 [Candidatus Sulfotelmatobacter sp.]|nr:hypothetical protein [Candidatus Sulfotelmatobacter sp.]
MLNRKEALWLTLFFLLVVVSCSISQSLGLTSNGPIQWTKTYGSHEAYSIAQSKDGGYTLSGIITFSENFTSNDLLIRTDSAGNELWRKTVSGNRFIQTSDNGYVLLDRDFLIKRDSSGNQQWSKKTGYFAQAIIQTRDGGYALAGQGEIDDYGDTNLWIVKTDANGNQQWNKNYGKPGYNTAASLIQTGDGGYALTGNTLSLDGQHSLLIKTDSTGNLQWSKTYEGDWQSDVSNTVVQNNDGSYTIAGSAYIQNNGKSYQAFLLIRIDSTGNKIWAKTYRESQTSSCYCNSMVQTSDGGYAMAGGLSFSSSDTDFLLIKTNSDGIQLWNCSYAGANHASARSVIQTSDGGYAMAGITEMFEDTSHQAFLTGKICLVKVEPDKPPITVDDYDGLWHTTDFTVKLTGKSNNSASISNTYYRINGGPAKTVNSNGQPTITNEGINQIEYWSVDTLGYEETPHKNVEIKLDKTAPTGSITINNNEASTNTPAVTLTLNYVDTTSNVALVRYSNDGIWDTENWENPAPSKTWNLTPEDGLKTVYYQIKDNAGLLSTIYSKTITLNTNTIPEFQVTLTVLIFMITSTLVLMFRKNRTIN